MSESNGHTFPASKEEQAATGHYGMVAETGPIPIPMNPLGGLRGPLWLTPAGQLVDANGNQLVIGVR